MTRALLLTLTGLLPCLHAENHLDLLRFSNGDQLHGTFQGIEEGPNLIWKREDLDDTAKFGIKDLRHLVMRGGNPAVPLKSISLVELVNGDQIPGKVTALSEEEVTIETSFAGILTLERNKVARIAPQPLGGRLHYHGPFAPEPWEVVSYKSEESDEDVDFNGEEKPDAEDKEEVPDWRHSGAAWYWGSNQPGTALILRDSMPERSTVRFDIAWKNQLNMAIAVHADFCVDEKKAAEENEEPQEALERARFIAHDSSSLPAIFGNAFVLQIHSNYMVIYRAIVDEEGNHSVKRVKTASSRLNFGENATTSFELRSDLKQSVFTLFANGKFVTQWSDPAHKNDAITPVTGSSLAFLPQASKSRVKLTDVIIAEWNGMPDSARSLQTETQDIILMTNGLDRLAGKALTLEENQMLRFKGKHGEFLLPLDEISELHMATGDLLKVEPPSGKRVKARFSPMGVITGSPLSGDRKSMVLRHELAGDITINNDAAVMFEFNDIKELFTDWDANF